MGWMVLFMFISASSSSLLVLASLHRKNLLALYIFVRIKHGCGKICVLLIDAKHGNQPLVQGRIFEVPTTLDHPLFGCHPSNLCWKKSFRD
jgi:hypothetical protein